MSAHRLSPTPGEDDYTLDGAQQVSLQHRLETIFERAPVGIGIVDLDGRTRMTNEQLRRSLGYDRDEFASMNFVEYTHPDDVQPNLDLFAQLAAGAIDSFSMEKRFIRKDGSIIWVDLTVALVSTSEGAADYVIGMTQDITDRKRLQNDLLAAERRYRHLVERVPAVVYIADPGLTGTWHYVSPQIEEVLGFSADEWMADPGLWARQLHPEDRAGALLEEDRVLDAGVVGETTSDTYRLRRRDGSTIWVRDDAMVMWDEDGRPTFHGVLLDVTREKHLEGRLSHAALHDPLTGLANRKLFQERVIAALASQRKDPAGVAVLFIDLDNFKAINDRFGHACGDEVIRTAARRLQGCVREQDSAARLGGDEFALLLQNTTATQVETVADRVLQALRQRPVTMDGRTIQIGASVGTAFAEAGDTAETLLRNADLAMYRVKHTGRGGHALYRPSLHQEVIGRFQLEKSLHAAVDGDAITLAFQPIADLSTGRVAGLEALARWWDPELGDVSPAEFIPAAERTGIIGELGHRLLTQACASLVEWQRKTGADAYVSVNVSPLQLEDESFPNQVRDVLHNTGLPVSALVLEVTEGVRLGESGRSCLHRLHDQRVRIAIDDFGTGYSSLSYLRQVPASIVKIDQTFVRAGPAGVPDLNLLQAVASLASSLGLTAIGEGVETAADLAALRTTVCRFGQGYLLGRPGALPEIPVTLPVLSEPDEPLAALAAGGGGGPAKGAGES